jgi:C-terminal processing protease CtpA/Prc
MRKAVLYIVYLLIISQFSFTLVAENINKINDRNQKNIVAFAEVYGFARYYYPRKKVNNEVWEKLVVKGLQMTYNCQNDNELIDSLNAYLSFVAPEILITKIPLKDTLTSKELAKKRYYLEHHGFGEGQTSFYKSEFINKIIAKLLPFKTLTKKEKQKIKQKYLNYNTNGFAINIPYSSPKKMKYLDKRNNHQDIEDEYLEHIAAVVTTWNIMKHFFPYQEELKEKWNEILETSLSIIEKDNLDYSTLWSLKHIAHCLDDGHAVVYTDFDYTYFSPPFTCRIINNELYVDFVHSESDNDINRGSKILEINGTNVQTYIDSLSKQVSASTEIWKNRRLERELTIGKKDTEITLNILENDSVVSKKFKRNKITEFWINETKKEFFLLQDSIYYVHIEKLENKKFKKEIPNINKSKGLIIEYGYPYGGANILQHFTDSNIKSPIWKIPIKSLYSFDDTLYVDEDKQRGKIKPSKQKITVPTVFITKDNTLSAAETSLDMIKHYKLGTIIGEPTGGANGNVNMFFVKNKKYRFAYTGMKAINNSGEQATKGIQPDIYVPVTAEGLKNNKDEILDAAIEYIKNLEK